MREQGLLGASVEVRQGKGGDGILCFCRRHSNKCSVKSNVKILFLCEINKLALFITLPY